MLFCIFNVPNQGHILTMRGDLMIVNRMKDDSWLRCHTTNRCDWTGVRRLHVALIDWSPMDAKRKNITPALAALGTGPPPKISKYRKLI